MTFNRKDLAAGLLMIATGVFACAYSLTQLRIGEALAMGPGYFPAMLGFALIAFGVAIAVFSPDAERSAFGPVPWRGLVLVIGSVIYFAYTVRPLGLLPALLGATFLATISNKDSSFRLAIIISVLLTAFNVGVFIYALKLPYALIGPLLLNR